MCYRARVTLSNSFVRIHTRPAAWIAQPLHGLEASVQFHRGGRMKALRREVVMVDIMQAQYDLGLEAGVSFEVECRGPQAQKAFCVLQERLTTSYFEGSEFVPLTSGRKSEDV